VPTRKRCTLVAQLVAPKIIVTCVNRKGQG
jgi:hypothetical protein